jgi:hypothetical protein
VFETWRLPEGTFRSGKQAPCVIFARLGPSTTQTRVYRQVEQRDLEKFYASGAARISLLVTDQGGGQDFAGELLSRLRLNTGLSVGDVAYVRNGYPVDDIQDVERPDGPDPFLPDFERVLASGAVRSSDKVQVRFPDGFSRGKTVDPGIFFQSKLLVSATSWLNNPWRLKVADDEIGVIPRNSMHVVIPNDHEESTRLALLAVLGSSVASLWVDARSGSRNIRVETVRTVPIPPEESWSELARLGRKVRDTPPGKERDAHFLEMEDGVWDALGLTADDRAFVRAHLAGWNAKEGKPRFPPSAASEPAHEFDHSRQSRRPGTVLDVVDGRVLLHVPGITPPEGTWTAVPETLPGWLARPGMGVTVHAAGRGLGRADYRFQTFAWAPMNLVLEPFATVEQ